MPVEITDWNDFDAIRNDLSGSYILKNDLDSSTAGYDSIASASANDGKGFDPLGEYATDPFKGTLDGNGYTVDGIFIDRPSISLLGIIPDLSGATIKNIGFTNLDITGGDNVAPLSLILANGGVVDSCFFTGSVKSENYVRAAGLIEYIAQGTVKNTYSTVDVTIPSGQTGDSVGGLLNRYFGGSIETSFYAGNLPDGASGLTVESGGSIVDSYWDTEVSGTTSTGGGGTGLTTSEMTGTSAESNLTGFDFANVWRATGSYPELRTFVATFSAATNPATNVATTSADISGEVVQLGAYLSSADVYLQYRQKGTSTWTDMPKTTVTNPPTTVTESLTGIQSGTNFEFRVAADNTGENQDEPYRGTILEFQTEFKTIVDGVVTDNTGDPVEGANVAIMPIDESLDDVIVQTDSNGKYSYNLGTLDKYLIISVSYNDGTESFGNTQLFHFNP